MIEDGDEQVNEDRDDDEVEVPKAPTNGKKAASSSKESDRKKRELITMGKAKGFLTYDEVNDAMPETIVSSDQIDDWLHGPVWRRDRDRRATQVPCRSP